MYIQINEYEMLELFCNEPISIQEKEAGMFIYRKQDTHGFELSMYISIYENICNISLSHKELTKSIFDFELEKVSKIDGHSDKMVIHQMTGNIIIYFKPNFSIKFK